MELSLEKIEELASHAVEAARIAYCPYSNYHVGAALLCDDGTIITGCNVENASYGLCICAERTALVKAISMGKAHNFPAMAIYAPDGSGLALPCGACRQFLVEFNPDIMVYAIDSKDGKSVKSSWKASELLPCFFNRTAMAC